MAGAGPDAVADLAHAPLGEIVFAARPYGPDGHYYANFGYYCQDPNLKAYPVGGRLYRFDPTTGKTAMLLDDPRGGVRDPQVHYDGRKLIFSWRKGGTDHYHLYEMNVDGSSRRQLTDGPFDDIEPTYLPDGGIAFCSSRCNRWRSSTAATPTAAPSAR
jgi:Tol biopolymer transport system component